MVLRKIFFRVSRLNEQQGLGTNNHTAINAWGLFSSLKMSRLEFCNECALTGIKLYRSLGKSRICNDIVLQGLWPAKKNDCPQSCTLPYLLCGIWRHHQRIEQRLPHVALRLIGA